MVSVHSSLEIQPENTPLGPTVERLLELENQHMRLDAERSLLEDTIERLSNTRVDPGNLVRSREERATDRFGTALKISEMLREVSQASAERLSELLLRIDELEQEIEKRRLEDAQTSDQARMGLGHPKRSISIHLAGEGPVEDLTVSYVVRAARWWPMYTLAITNGGKEAELGFESLVAQRTGEDWAGVALGLSTSDLLRDAQLPELRSLRIGKAQPVARSGFREPPAGLDMLFGPYDRVFGGMPEAPEFAGVMSEDEGSGIYPEELALEASAEYLDEMPPAPPMAPMAKSVSRGAPQRSKKMKEEAPAVVMASAPSAASFDHAEFDRLLTPKGVAPSRAMRSGFFGNSGGGGAPPEPEAEPIPAGPELSGAWLDFDGLRLAPASDFALRGRLHPSAQGPEARSRSMAESKIEGLAPRDMLCDPLWERGSFDHRYDGEGRVDVPSDGLSHRLRMSAKGASPRFSYRVVPKEAPEVYRTVELDNPFDAPLLGGPVEVYLDGTLLLVAPLRATDRGGKFRVGLGIEERIRVARNVTVQEDTAGLLRGSTAVEHRVKVELRSALGFGVDVELLERTPVTDESDLEVAMLPSETKAERYTQADQDAPIRGGWRWLLHVDPGEARTLNWGYKLVFPSKQEIVGGNRRD